MSSARASCRRVRPQGRRHQGRGDLRSPNVGKSTFFNRLTGLHQKVANYPGITVEKRIGRLELPMGRP